MASHLIPEVSALPLVLKKYMERSARIQLAFNFHLVSMD